MLKENDFRRVALGMMDAIEGAHMGHPDFRVHGRIFASLHHDRQMAGRGPLAGMVMLTPEQQQQLMQEHPEAFSPESGAWGRSGCTRVQLDAVDEDALGVAMTLAWQNTVDKPRTAKNPGTSKKKVEANTLETGRQTQASRKPAPARPR